MPALTKWNPVKVKVEELLANSHNRKLSRPHVERLTISMRAGAWNPAVSPILFYVDGHLADGQHRLAAWLQAGCPQDVWFYSAAIERDEIVKVDAGRVRTTRDHCTIMNEPFGLRHIAAARAALNMELNQAYDPGLLIATHEMLIDAAKRYNVRRFANKMLPSPVAGALAFIGDERGVAPFYDLVMHGENLTRHHPAYHLRALCLSSGRSNRNQRSTWAYKTVRAWNAYARGESMGVLKTPAPPFAWQEIESTQAAELITL